MLSASRYNLLLAGCKHLASEGMFYIGGRIRTGPPSRGGDLELEGGVQSMDDNCGEWVECMGVASGCG